MAEAGRRRQAALSFNKNICRIILLLVLVPAGQSLDLIDVPLNRVLNSIEGAKENVRVLRESESGTDIMLMLLEEVNSVANENQVKIFQEYHKEAVDEAYRQKVEKLADAKAGALQYHMFIMEKGPEMQRMKRSNGDPMEKLVKIMMSYAALQNQVFTGKMEETKKELEDTLKMLNSQN